MAPRRNVEPGDETAQRFAGDSGEQQGTAGSMSAWCEHRHDDGVNDTNLPRGHMIIIAFVSLSALMNFGYRRLVVFQVIRYVCSRMNT